MKNFLTDLQTHLFEQIEWLKDRDIKGEELNEEIKRSLAINELAKTAVTNGALMAKCVDTVYGLPPDSNVPLIPPSPAGKPVMCAQHGR